ncbi:MAG: Phytoene synthase [Pseudonocardiales bacterium]|nr:Phytoene synthase [Pseudonocardiales bacterium]
MGSVRQAVTTAGVSATRLSESYAACRSLNAAHGRTYFLATRLLPAQRRPAVHALYGFARCADEIVDDLGSTLRPEQKAAALRAWGAGFLDSLANGTPPPPATAESGPDVVPAVLDTIERYAIPHQYFADFLQSMEMDLTVARYETFDDLSVYMWGSAAVIGLQMLPILGTTTPVGIAAPYAADLGIAFQLTNFLRDVGEDLRRGRVYLPQESLRLFGVDEDRLRRGVVDGPIRRLLQFEIARTRELYRSAYPGLRLVCPRSRRCLEVAWSLYQGILDEIEGADYRVLDRRVSVGIRRRLATVARSLAS